MLDAIAHSKTRGLDKLLAGLKIPHVGNRVAYVLAKRFGSMQAIEKASVEELSETNEIGPVIADSVHHYFHSEAGKSEIGELQKVGVDPKMNVAPKAQATCCFRARPSSSPGRFRISSGRRSRS